MVLVSVRPEESQHLGTGPVHLALRQLGALAQAVGVPEHVILEHLAHLVDLRVLVQAGAGRVQIDHVTESAEFLFPELVNHSIVTVVLAIVGVEVLLPQLRLTGQGARQHHLLVPEGGDVTVHVVEGVGLLHRRIFGLQLLQHIPGDRHASPKVAHDPLAEVQVVQLVLIIRLGVQLLPCLVEHDGGVPVDLDVGVLCSIHASHNDLLWPCPQPTLQSLGELGVRGLHPGAVGAPGGVHLQHHVVWGPQHHVLEIGVGDLDDLQGGLCRLEVAAGQLRAAVAALQPRQAKDVGAFKEHLLMAVQALPTKLSCLVRTVTVVVLAVWAVQMSRRKRPGDSRSELGFRRSMPCLPYGLQELIRHRVGPAVDGGVHHHVVGHPGHHLNRVNILLKAKHRQQELAGHVVQCTGIIKLHSAGRYLLGVLQCPKQLLLLQNLNLVVLCCSSNRKAFEHDTVLRQQVEQLGWIVITTLHKMGEGHVNQTRRQR
mmetsp:Transcript_7680/g.13597  ORF Transcript_7680/g.13597 Transcript_7680/m.13597 type:complete len:485 (-) Transcript_7680:361-1815(-)